MRYVLGAAEHGSFRRAAGALNVQQSTISRRVRELEDRLGAAIFERGAAGVRLTKVGARFLEGAQSAVTQLAQAVGAVTALSRAEQDLVRIGLAAPLTPGYLADLLRTATARSPRLRLSIREGPSSDLVGAVQAGRLDLAFLAGPPAAAGCEGLPLWTERLFVACAEGSSLAAKARIERRDLDGRALLTWPGCELTDRVIAQIGQRADPLTLLPQAAGRETVLQLVALGQGLAVVPQSATALNPGGVAYRPLARTAVAFGAIWSRQRSKPAVRRLLTLARAG